jgi:hypothetical protein
VCAREAPNGGRMQRLQALRYPASPTPQEYDDNTPQENDDESCGAGTAPQRYAPLMEPMPPLRREPL